MQAYILRFINQLRSKTYTTLSLSVQELEDAKMQILRNHQEQKFAKDIEIIQQQKDPAKNHKRKNLNPFFNEDTRVFRVGGRLYQSELGDNQKHQVLIDANSHLTTLLVRYRNHLCLHAGPQCTLCSLKQKFWCTNARNNVRRIKRV